MIRHIAVITLKPECADAQAQQLIDMIADLAEHIAEVKCLSVGRSVGLDGSATHDVAMVADFVGVAELKTYLEHPRHRAVSAFVATIKEKATGADFEVVGA
ncbi:Dabb family protein [Streptomyces sp. NBC_01320]|uniref:Dabb family protein n=1 Tax=Streptomyces sp. NBC_01320 TaxID=2903824 RepID=UPI002E159F41|nr:Dabb family protein [Streptomyces sp. NBC_01320]